MALATEDDGRALVNDTGAGSSACTLATAPRIAAGISALALMAIAANCFLKYLWWAAKSSALAGIPKLADQWQTAATRASVYGWTLLMLEIAGFLLTYIVIRSRQHSPLRNALRLLPSIAITLVVTGLFALALSWFKQSH